MSEEKQYNLFNINRYNINTSEFNHMLEDYELELEEKIAEYVGAKYACIGNSASSLMQISLMALIAEVPPELLQSYPLSLPTMIPPAVANIVHNAASISAIWEDNIGWVGDSYTLYDTKNSFEQIYKTNVTEDDTGQDEESAPEHVRMMRLIKDRYSKPYKIIDSAQKIRRNQFVNEAFPNDIMIFSLYPTKPIGCMDGGILVSNDKEKINFFKSMSHLGAHPKSEAGEIIPSSDSSFVFPGFKMNPNSAQCYTALKNLEKLDDKNKRLDEISAIYNKELGYYNNSNHLYRIRVKRRGDFMSKMFEDGIQVGIHYMPQHLRKEVAYRFTMPGKPLVDSEIEGLQTVSIPFHENLSNSDLDFIIGKIKSSELLIDYDTYAKWKGVAR